MPETEVTERSHRYSAEATILKGHLHIPLVTEVKPQAFASLPTEGGYLSQRAESFRAEEAISFRSGHTQVAGNRSDKVGEGWSTLTTMVVEGVNVLDVLTADRVVGQIVTDHPPEGHVPSISFLGTTFENLRISGHPVHLKLNLGILGTMPKDNQPYGLDSGLKDRINDQYHRIRKSDGLPEDQRQRYNQLSSTLGSPDSIECSLVDEVSGDYPGSTCGHMINVPNFGLISLATVQVTYKEVREGNEILRKTTVNLTMIDLKLGCAISGNLSFAAGGSNGSSQP